jgi:hypothetical protein
VEGKLSVCTEAGGGSRYSFEPVYSRYSNKELHTKRMVQGTFDGRELTDPTTGSHDASEDDDGENGVSIVECQTVDSEHSQLGKFFVDKNVSA